MTTELVDNERNPQTVLADRDNHAFNIHSDLGNRPVAIQGTNKVYFQHRDLSVEDAPSKQVAALNDLIRKCEEVDRSIQLTRLPSLSALEIHAVDPRYIVFKTSVTGNQLFVVPAPTRKDVLAFKRLSTLLSIPYSFSKKNPTFLNRINFDYYLDRFKSGEEKPQAIDLVYDSTLIALELHEGQGEEAKVTNLEAHLVKNFLKVSGQRRARPSAATPEVNPDAPSVAQTIPLFSSILSGVRKEIQGLGFDLGVQSHSLGYEGGRGHHYARLLLEGPGTTLKLNGEEYRIGIAVDTDFIGNSQDFGDVRYGVQLFRLICSNGMVAAWSKDDMDDFKVKFMADAMAARGFQGLDPEHHKENAEFVAAYREAEALFHIQFGTDGITVPVVQANAGIPTQMLGAAVRYILASGPTLEARFTELKTPFTDVNPEDFLKTSLALQKSYKLSPELTKYLNLEYVAGKVSGNQLINSPNDVLQFLTSTSRAYDALTMRHTEECAMEFAQSMYDELIAKVKEKPKQSLFDQYRGQLQERLLGEA